PCNDSLLSLIFRAPSRPFSSSIFFFMNPPPPQLSPLSLHDALPISIRRGPPGPITSQVAPSVTATRAISPDGSAWHSAPPMVPRSEEHTSELQSLTNLVCRLLLEKKKQQNAHTSEILAQHHPHLSPA